MDLKISNINKIPKELRTKETKTNCQFFILDNPNSPMPISSGKGEAMIIAPRTGIIQEKYGLSLNLGKRELLSFLKKGLNSSKI